MIPGSGRSPGEGIGYPLQYSWAYLVAQSVKNPPAMWETWIQFLGRGSEDANSDDHRSQACNKTKQAEGGGKGGACDK